MYENLSVEEFKNKIDSWEYILVDVRRPEEKVEFWEIDWTQISINCQEFLANLKFLKLDKTKKYLLYCWHWNRSKQVQNFMKSNWFTEVHELDKWIDEWNKVYY